MSVTSIPSNTGVLPASNLPAPPTTGGATAGPSHPSVEPASGALLDYTSAQITATNAFALLSLSYGPQSSDPTSVASALLSAVYYQPLANQFNALAANATAPVSQSYAGGVSLSAGNTTAPGVYTVGYDPTQQAFTLYDTNGNTTTGLPQQGNTVTLGDGLTLSLGQSFDPTAPLAAMTLHVPMKLTACGLARSRPAHALVRSPANCRSAAGGGVARHLGRRGAHSAAGLFTQSPFTQS